MISSINRPIIVTANTEHIVDRICRQAGTVHLLTKDFKRVNMPSVG